MKIEHKSFNEYWSEVGTYIGIQDKITVVASSDIKYLTFIPDDWEDIDNIIKFADSSNTLISIFNIEKETAIYFIRCLYRYEQ